MTATAAKTRKLPQKSDRSSSRRSRELLLIAVAAVVFYLFICLFSYHPGDPGWSFSGGDGSINNVGGPFGAWFADVMLQVFGYSAFLLPVILILFGWRVFRSLSGDPPTLNRRLIHAGGIVVTLLAFSGIEHLHFSSLSAAMEFPAGGVFGDIVSAWLARSFGSVGATVSLLVALVAGVSWATDLSWFAVMDFIGREFYRFIGWLGTTASEWVDRIKGARSRRQRAASVSEIRKEFETRKPPRIEPKITLAPQSGRRERESQETLFNEPKERIPTGSLPALTLLDSAQATQGGFSRASLEHMSRLLEKKLRDFNIEVQVVAVQPGPVVTRFEIEPAPGVKASQIVGLSRDLARALSVVSIRVVENIPGKTVIGLEVPNEIREVVNLIEGLNSEEYEKSKSPLTLVMGKDIAGLAVIADLAKMPHVLIAGTTGSGKSVCINALILSLVYKSTPRQVRMIMIDPKLLELSVYEDIPHLLAPVVTDMQKAANALRWCIVEMDRRFRLMAALGVRNIVGYNRKVGPAAESGKPIFDPLASVGEGESPEPLDELPYIVVIIDELADLLMVVGKKIEELITRIAQRARAAGIHLVLATQRPSVDVVTGLIKANVPTRVAFQVSSRADSRVVIDQMGAEQLLGHGDMLFLPPGSGLPMRVHGSFVSDQEVQRVADELRRSGEPDYVYEITEGDYSAGNGGGGDAFGDSGGGEADPLYDQALRFVTETRRASISAVQRHLRVGYNRAARMIEAMEMSGVVGPSENGKRAVLAPPPPQ